MSIAMASLLNVQILSQTLSFPSVINKDVTVQIVSFEYKTILLTEFSSYKVLSFVARCPLDNFGLRSLKYSARVGF